MNVCARTEIRWTLWKAEIVLSQSAEVEGFYFQLKQSWTLHTQINTRMGTHTHGATTHTNTRGTQRRGWAHTHKGISTCGILVLMVTHLIRRTHTHTHTHTPVFLCLSVVPLCFIWQLIPREAPLCIHLRSPQHRHPVNTHSQGERRRRWPRSKHAHWHHQPAHKDTFTKSCFKPQMNLPHLYFLRLTVLLFQQEVCWLNVISVH